MPRPNWFRSRRSTRAAGGAYDDVRFVPEGNDRYYLITRLSVIDETSAPATDIRVHVEGHGYNHLVMEQNTPGANTLYTVPDPVRLMPGETLVARFTGATLADALQMYFEGWWTENDAGPWWMGGAIMTPQPVGS